MKEITGQEQWDKREVLVYSKPEGRHLVARFTKQSPLTFASDDGIVMIKPTHYQELVWPN